MTVQVDRYYKKVCVCGGGVIGRCFSPEFEQKRSYSRLSTATPNLTQNLHAPLTHWGCAHVFFNHHPSLSREKAEHIIHRHS